VKNAQETHATIHRATRLSLFFKKPATYWNIRILLRSQINANKQFECKWIAMHMLNTYQKWKSVKVTISNQMNH